MLQLFANVLITASVALLVAVSFSTVYWVARFFHFALGGIIVAGAYCAYAVLNLVPSSPILAVFGAALGGGLLGVTLEVLVHRPLRLRGAAGSGFLLASLGAYIVIINSVSLVWGEQVRILAVARLSHVISMFGVRITTVQACEVGLAAATAICAWIALAGTRAGRAFRAVACDAVLARVVGIDAILVHVVALVAGSMLAGVVGLLVAADVDVRPGLGFPLLLLGVTAALLGRPGRVSSLVAGAGIVSIGQNLGAWFFGMQFREAITMLILLATLYLRRRVISAHLSQRVAEF